MNDRKSTDRAIAVRERGILMSAPMVRATLDGRKTQTRRVVKPQPTFIESSGRWKWTLPKRAQFPGCCTSVVTASREWWEYAPPEAYSYGVPGDRLWVRETWADTNGENGPMISYRAGGDRFLVEESYPVDYSRYPGCQFSMWCGDLRRGAEGHAWRSPIHMPRWASRILLEITEVRVQRLQDISELDARAEGVERDTEPCDHARRSCEEIGCLGPTHKASFCELWSDINGWKSWRDNPWVWALTFKRLAPI